MREDCHIDFYRELTKHHLMLGGGGGGFEVQMKCFFLLPNLKKQQKSGRLPFTVS